MVSAWATNQRIVLGQQVTEEKSNEITAIPLLLKHLLAAAKMRLQTATIGHVEARRAATCSDVQRARVVRLVEGAVVLATVKNAARRCARRHERGAGRNDGMAALIEQ